MNTRLILAAGAGAVGLYFGSAWYQKSRASQNTMPPVGGEHNKNKQAQEAPATGSAGSGQVTASSRSGNTTQGRKLDETKIDTPLATGNAAQRHGMMSNK
ncbi:hypothetical protein PROFUN_02432 [Planoprotostelium fungivorum]|uniref:Uncharacterized protein n=1 Tax=Planoprotostelium fungivorum TaxID=1890364 RepID=A0A2P6NUT4_9EUKA|nr:hypothetical protein PROFUN_02432 [Planoprotostelium fungivorum]